VIANLPWLLAGCAPPIPDWVVEEPLDLSYATADWGPLLPGESLDVDLYAGDVLRVYDGEGALRSAWELAFPFGGTVVLQW